MKVHGEVAGEEVEGGARKAPRSRPLPEVRARSTPQTEGLCWREVRLICPSALRGRGRGGGEAPAILVTGGNAQRG